MKRKLLATLMLVGALAIVPTFAFGAGSKENTGGGGSGSSSGSTSSTTTTVATPGVTVLKPGTNLVVQIGSGSSGTSEPEKTKTTTVSETGTITSTIGTTVDKTETWYGIIVDTTTTEGTPIVANNDGSVTIGEVEVKFVTGNAETAGLPETIVGNIDALNSGKPVKEIFGDSLGIDLSNVERVGGTRAVVVTDQNTGLTNTATEFMFQVSAVEATGTYSLLYYDNNTGRWILVPVTVDPITMQIKVKLPGSCTIQLVKANPVVAPQQPAAAN